MASVLRKMAADRANRFAAEAASVPADIASKLRARAIEAVESGEAYKVTGGWVCAPFSGQASTIGMLEIACKELRKAQFGA